jgi:maltose-binding protein MalE
MQSLQKWEKNVRRRVYDALNVLYAAGVLRKEGKHVFCDSKAKEMFEHNNGVTKTENIR